MLTGRLYEYNIAPVMKDEHSINLGSVYESVVAQELKAHGHDLFYYDNAKKGEVDYLVNNVVNDITNNNVNIAEAVADSSSASIASAA